MEVILDTNFIVSCVRKNIDFISQLEEQGFTIKVPQEVMHEMKDLRLKSSRDDKLAIDVALELIVRKNIKKTKLGHNKIDVGLIDKGKKGVHIATLDKEILRNVPHSIIIFDAQKRVGPSL